MEDPELGLMGSDDGNGLRRPIPRIFARWRAWSARPDLVSGIGTIGAGYDNSNGLPRLLPRSSSVAATGRPTMRVRRSIPSAMAMMTAGT